jgi:Uma2 family endonuclease
MTRIISRPASRDRLPVGPLSYDEFLKWDGENQHVEWVDGEIVPMAAVTDDHSLVNGFCYALVRDFVEIGELGEVRQDPFQMKTGPKLPGRAPDLLFVTKKNVSRLKRLYLDGPADLVIEVISPRSRSVDRGRKFDEYEEGGVREYWLIDPERKQAEFYARGRDGIFELMAVSRDGVFSSKVLKGLWIKVDWLWQRPMPPLWKVRKTLGLP